MFNKTKSSDPIARSLDRWSALDGVIVAVGWCGVDTPKIVCSDGIPLAQITTRYDRPDVASILGKQVSKTAGFRIAAQMDRNDRSNDDVFIEFSDGSRLQSANAHPEDQISDLMNQFINLTRENPTGTMIEIGSRARSGNTYRQLFPDTIKHIGMDITDGPNVNLVGDAHKLSHLTDRKFDFAFSVSVFEHLIMPWVAAFELNKVLNVGGYAYIQSHPSWPLHERPWDFFRFSTDAYSGLFNPLTGFEMIRAEYGLETSLVPRSMGTAAMGSAAMQHIESEPSFLVSGCLVRKVSDPKVDWATDPSEVYDMGYSH